MKVTSSFRFLAKDEAIKNGKDVIGVFSHNFRLSKKHSNKNIDITKESYNYYSSNKITGNDFLNNLESMFESDLKAYNTYQQNQGQPGRSKKSFFDTKSGKKKIYNEGVLGLGQMTDWVNLDMTNEKNRLNIIDIFQKQLELIQNEVGGEVLNYQIHFDEKTPHCHFQHIGVSNVLDKKTGLLKYRKPNVTLFKNRDRLKSFHRELNTKTNNYIQENNIKLVDINNNQLDLSLKDVLGGFKRHLNNEEYKSLQIEKDALKTQINDDLEQIRTISEELNTKKSEKEVFESEFDTSTIAAKCLDDFKNMSMLEKINNSKIERIFKKVIDELVIPISEKLKTLISKKEKLEDEVEYLQGLVEMNGINEKLNATNEELNIDNKMMKSQLNDNDKIIEKQKDEINRVNKYLGYYDIDINSELVKIEELEKIYGAVVMEKRKEKER